MMRMNLERRFADEIMELSQLSLEGPVAT